MNAIARLLSTVDWPDALVDDADVLIQVLQNLAASLADDETEAAAQLATDAHEAQHELSHAAQAWIAEVAAAAETQAAPMAAAPAEMMSADGVIDADGLLIENVRANLSLPSPTGSVWLRITNNTDADETLLGADVPGCGVVELHEMVMKNEVMTMQQVAGGEIPIPAGESVELKRGGLHIMCIQKAAPLEVGSEVDIALYFENAGEVDVTAPVVAPDNNMGGGN